MSREEVTTFEESPPAASRGEEGKLSGVSQHLENRRVKIYMPAKHAMQSASYKTRVWKLEFDQKETWVNPLMGWTSSSDTTTQLHDLSFESAESAARFCDRQGIAYEIVEPPRNADFKGLKNYGDNFLTDRIKVGIQDQGESFFDHGEDAHTSAWSNVKRNDYEGDTWSDEGWKKYRNDVPKRS